MMIRIGNFIQIVVDVGGKYFWPVLIIFFYSCASPAKKLQKAQRLIDRAIQLGAVVEVDTIFIEKSILIPSIDHDTIVERVNFRDTITITKDKLITRVKIDTVNHSIFIETKMPADTIIVEVPAAINNKIQAGYTVMQTILFTIGGFGIGLLTTLVIALFKLRKLENERKTSNPA